MGDGATRDDEGGIQAISSAFVLSYVGPLGSLAEVLLAGSVGIAFGVLVYCLRKRRKKHRPRADFIGCVEINVWCQWMFFFFERREFGSQTSDGMDT